MTTENIQSCINSYFSSDDPPVPQGATKFSYSATISNCKILICDTGLDFFDVKVHFQNVNCHFQYIIIIHFVDRLVVWKVIARLKQTIVWYLDFMQ